MHSVILGFLAFGVSVGGLAALGQIKFSFSGIPAPGDGYLYQVIRNKRRVIATRIGVNLPDTLRFVLRDELALDVAAKWLGLAREWQTDDASFDRKVYILSEDRELLDALTRDAQLRELVRGFLSRQGVRTLHCYGGRLWTETKNTGSQVDTGDLVIACAAAEELLPGLKAIRDRLMEEHAPMWRNERDPGMRRYRVLAGACGALGVAGATCAIWSGGSGLPRPLVQDAILRHATAVALPVGLMLFLAVLSWIGRASRTHLLVLQVLLVATPGAWLISATSWELHNERFDYSPPQVVHAGVARLYVTHGRHSTYYHVVVTGWPDRRFEPSQIIDGYTYRHLSGGGCVDLTVHAGALGDPWLSDIEPGSGC